MRLLGSMKVEDNKLSIGGVDVATLAKEYGTPLYIIDQEELEDKCKLFKENFSHPDLRGEVAYASKAFLTVGMAQLINKEGLSIDVVSGGELYTVHKAGFPMDRVYFHGNNKTLEELELAIRLKCRNIIIDNRHEAKILGELLEKHDYKMNVFLRVNPGISAETHDYIKTTTDDSKFGESIFQEDIYQILRDIKVQDYMNFKGLHCHIGSQIFEEESFLRAVDEMLYFYQLVKNELDIEFESINLGGGFGVYYAEGDRPIDLGPFLQRMIDYIYQGSRRRELTIRHVLIEPGRSIISNAGSTLYTVGGTKETYSGKKYIFIDGGMSDNPRPALYQAKYEAIIANKAEEAPDTLYTVAGKLCESGDVLIEDIKLPRAEAGDLLLISSTGAYTFSMFSNYNRVLRPAVALVKGGSHRLMVRRQTYEDLVSLDEELI